MTLAINSDMLPPTEFFDGLRQIYWDRLPAMNDAYDLWRKLPEGAAAAIAPILQQQDEIRPEMRPFDNIDHFFSAHLGLNNVDLPGRLG